MLHCSLFMLTNEVKGMIHPKMKFSHPHLLLQTCISFFFFNIEHKRKCFEACWKTEAVGVFFLQ